ncbi:MAG TPA: M3 family metallopeptidase [Polyangiaceae bacterium]|nr:M3 family metallopeptidase [Polyangiaceae bacterium]
MKASQSLIGVALALVLTACVSAPQKPVLPAITSAPQPGGSPSPSGEANPFLRPSSLPYEMPPFDRITDASYRPAFEAGMVEQRAQVTAIANDAATPNFDNTIVALERSGRILYRVSSVFFNLQGANTNDELDTIARDIAPKLSEHQDAIYLDPKLFVRVKSLYERREALHLDPESAQLLARTHLQFVRAGANCSDADKARLRQINGQLSSLTTQFQQNVRQATQAGAVVVDDVADLDGFSAEQIGAAAAAAQARNLTGKWLITLQNTTIQPPLAQLKKRALRERIYRASIARANGGAADNTALILQIVRLRAERARVLGYSDYAAYVLEDETASTPAAVNKLLGDLAPPAIAKAKREAADLQALIDREAKAQQAPPFKLEAWDWAFYAEQLRQARFAYDEAQVKPYFELNRVLNDGVFYAATQFYGITFKERHDLPLYRADVRAFEIFDHDGSPLALFFCDNYARDNKQGGAWMNSYVDQSTLLGTKPVIANHLNIPKPAEGQPTLLTFDEVTTLFHEFGHALHGLFSNVKYQSLSGTNTPPDFVEFPSQYNEMWADEPVVIANYAKHYQTGAAIPPALLKQVLLARKFNQGFVTSEYIAAAILDQSWHQVPAAHLEKLPQSAEQVMPFEAAALKAAGVDFAPVPPRYHSPYFLHVFSSGYAAGYYAYLWSDVLARDTESWVHAHGGLKRESGDLLRAKILSRGRTVEPAKLFQDFYGGPPDIAPLLESRGLTLGASKPPSGKR